jgi:type I restriction enzyme, R subunit
MTRITEKRDVQDQLINYLTGIGWTFIGQYDLPALRHQDETEPFLIDTLRSQLAALNGWPAGDSRIDQIVRRLRLLPPTLEGNEEYLHALRGHWTVYDPATQRERNVTLIDYSNLKANRFHFTEEMWFQDRDRRRMDMVLFVNGLPVLLVENKSPKLEDPGMEGFQQVQDTYTRMIPEFLKYPIPFSICATRLEYGATWNPDLKTFYKWKANGRDYGLEDLSKTFFAQEQVLKLLRDYTIFYRMDDALQKLLLRPHQMRAVEKIVERVVAGQADLTAPDRGLEGHTQGSGKTLTMIVAAHLLRQQPTLDNPTIIFVVDRLDLESQMLQNLEAFGLSAIPAVNRHHLQHLLAKDTRGVIVTTIHKFDHMPKAICLRRNVVVLVDEAHRSQEGDLGVYMNAALPQAFQFGFTGTPIDRGKVGKGTYETFGHKEDARGLHDEYTINESIEDGTTLPLFYTLAPTNIWVDKLNLEADFAPLLDEFWQLVDEEGAGTQEALSKLLERADKLMAVLKAPQRIDAIAAHIAQHFQDNVLPLGFKALVVTPDREACALYKQALNQYLPESWSRVVYSQAPKRDHDLMKEYYLDEDEEKRVRKAFRDPQQDPKLLIVTQKLLTGYDAPVAYAMYLDKPLKDHTLLQAIARVNRPYPTKKSGLVVDYIGVFKDLQRALSGNTAGVERGLIDYETLKPHFADLMAQTQATLAPIDPTKVTSAATLPQESPEGSGQISDAVKQRLGQDRTARIVDYFWDEDRRSAFFQQFKELEAAYEILSPDPFLYEYLDDYALVADVYQAAHSYFDPQAEQRRQQRDLLAKTEALIQTHTHAGPVSEPLPLYPINRNLADVIASDQIPERVKVINLQRSIIAHIQKNLEVAPYLVSIGEEVEKVIEQLKLKQISAQTALAVLEAKAQQIVETDEERVASPLDNLAFALRTTLRAASLLAQMDDGMCDTVAQTMAMYLQEHASWRHNSKIEQSVRMDLYRQLLPHIPRPFKPDDAKVIVDNLLKMHKIAM